MITLKFRKLVIIISLLTIVISNQKAFAETITLKSGSFVEGKIIEKNQDSIVIDIGIPVNYSLDEIKEIDGKPVDQEVLKSGNISQEIVKYFNEIEIFANKTSEETSKMLESINLARQNIAKQEQITKDHLNKWELFRKELEKFYVPEPCEKYHSYVNKGHDVFEEIAKLRLKFAKEPTNFSMLIKKHPIQQEMDEKFNEIDKYIALCGEEYEKLRAKYNFVR